MDYQNTIDKAADFVNTYLRGHEHGDLLYHNLTHTKSLVAAVDDIARHSSLSNREHFITSIAAWFSDIGYYEDPLKPGEASVTMAEGFLKAAGADPGIISEVGRCIKVIDGSQPPVTLAEQVISDASFFFLGAQDFTTRNKLLRKETEALDGTSIPKDEWCRRTVALMESHHYHTPYAIQMLNKRKKQNLIKLKKKVKEKQVPVYSNGLFHEEPFLQDPPPKQNGNTLHPEKGTETLFRVTSGVSQRLSEQADNKANILISVNSIIMSILLSIVVARLDRYPHLTIPIILFLGVNLVTITFSILATRPAVPKGTFDPRDVETNKVNLLFFGNFYRMNFDDYSNGMYKVLGDRNYLYYSFIRNLYEHGVVLGRKYRKLKTAYNIFMYGIIVSVIAFVIASEFFAK